MIYLYLLVMLVFTAYIIHSGYLYIKEYNKVPKSLSATGKLYNKPIFMYVMWFIAFALLPVWLELMPLYQFLAFISCTGLLFVGATPKYESDRLQRVIHFTGAYTGSIATMLIIILNGYWFALFPIVLFLILGACISNLKETWTYWFEIGLFNSIFISLMLSL